MQLCEYGCGQEAKFQMKNGKWCCCNSWNSCIEIKKKKIGRTLSQMQRNNISIRTKESMRNDDIIKNMSLKKKLSINQIQERYPTFCKEEEMRYNPDKPTEEREIQVHCKNSNCENSKEKGGWFTPTRIQWDDRRRALETDRGNDGAYLYCSQHCKDTCPLYGSHGSDPFKEPVAKPYTDQEYQIWRQKVLKQDNHECQKCGSKENLHCHHIEPVKLQPELSLDPSNGIILCQICHIKYGHKSGTECSLSNLAKKKCKEGATQ